MKLSYSLLSCLLLVAGTALAQTSVQRASTITCQPAAPVSGVHAQQTGARDGGDIVFSEDFANGLDGNNGQGFWTVEGPNGNIWRHFTAQPWGAFTGHPQPERIASTTVANGFMLFNSDSANTNWGDTTMVAVPTDWEGSLVSPLLDLSLTPYVELVFEQRFRYCCQDAPYFLEVSSDGGDNWTSQFDISEGIGANDPSGTITTRVNITGAISGDPSNVKFRFRHSSDAGTSHYHWQIDDVQLVEVFEYDLTIQSAANTYFDYDLAFSFDSLQYSIYPFGQLRPLGINMDAFNNGSVTQDAVANFTIMNGSNTVLDQDQDVLQLMPGETRKVFVSPDFTPPAEVGTYTVTHNLTSLNTDLDPSDNTSTTSFKVSENIYARDAGNPWTFETGDSTSMILSNAFHLVNPTTVYSIAVLVGNNSDAGSFLVGDIRDLDLETVWGETQEVTVTNSMMNGVNGQNFTHLIFDPPLDLEAGDYAVCVQVVGFVRIGESGTSVPQTSFIFYNGSAGEDWYYTTTTPSVRMGFDATVGINDEASLNNGLYAQSIPNPTNGITRLVYEMTTQAPVTVELFDVSGKMVMTFNEGNKAPGQHQLMFNVADLQAGVYFHTVRAGDSEVTGRMVVVK